MCLKNRQIERRLRLPTGRATMEVMQRAMLPSLLLSACLASGQTVDIQKQYGETAQKLIAAALKDDEGLARLQYLCDRIGARLGGSAALGRAVEWSAAEMKKAGLTNVQTPDTKVPHWVRGRESATMIAPVERPLPMLGLGMSVGTPPEGITADVVAVSSFEELSALGKARVEGKIVLFDPEWKGYGQTVMYRGSGGSQAAELGAVAAVVRSMTGNSLGTPHTGALNYTAGVAKIPVAALTVEDAAAIHRLVKAGVPVRIKLQMEAKQLPDAPSNNVMGEIRGSEKPEEVVVLGGHLDSWDVGQGAQDDGSGVIGAFQAVALIQKLGLKPKRTIRVVFWTNEENGGAGGRAYRAMVGDAVKNHVAAIEMDGGAEKPLGFGFGPGGEGRRRLGGSPDAAARNSISPAAFQRAVDIGKLLESINAGKMTPGGGGADIAPLMAAGVPAFGVRTVGEHYFDWHHTNADTFDKINPRDFRENVASLAVLAFVLADMPERIAEIK
jgi:hypothetical protein